MKMALESTKGMTLYFVLVSVATPLLCDALVTVPPQQQAMATTEIPGNVTYNGTDDIGALLR